MFANTENSSFLSDKLYPLESNHTIDKRVPRLKVARLLRIIKVMRIEC